jgi:AbrB family looped-hinge helix DNA binding protein
MNMMHGMKCYGSTVIGEKGQVVIPSELRKKFHIRPGDKFLVLAGERGVGITLLKVDALAKFVKRMFGSELQGILELEAGAVPRRRPSRRSPNKSKGKGRR